MEANDGEVIENDIEVSPVGYLGTTPFVIGLLVESGHLKVRRDRNGVPHFMKSDMDAFLSRARPRRQKSKAQDVEPRD